MTVLAMYPMTPSVLTRQPLQPPYSVAERDTFTSRQPQFSELLRYPALFGDLRDVAALSGLIVQRAINEEARFLETVAATASLKLTLIEGTELYKTLADIAAMLSWRGDDLVYSDPAPNPNAIAHSVAWVTGFYHDITTLGQRWVKPSVTLDEDGEVVFEWWHGDKSLGIFISDIGAQFLQAWGTDIEAEMRDGDAEPSETRQQLWAWLLS